MEVKDEINPTTENRLSAITNEQSAGRQDKEALTPPPGDDGQELERVRTELQRVGVEHNQQRLPNELLVKSIKKKPSFLGRIFDRTGYPSINDKRKILRIGYAAMEVATLSLIASKLAVDAAVNGSISPELGWFAADSLSRITTFSILPMIASLVASYYVSAKEHFNKTLYGKTLTVTKVATSSAKELAGLPLVDERFLGEMHFVGKGSFKNPLSFFVSDFFFKSEAENLRQGVADLYALAGVCSNNSPELQDVNVFFGVSPIVTKNLERFGFQVLPYEDHRNLVEKIVDAPLDIINFVTSSIPMRIRFKAHAIQSSQMTVVTKEKLIENKDKIKKLMDRLNRPQTLV